MSKAARVQYRTGVPSIYTQMMLNVVWDDTGWATWAAAYAAYQEYRHMGLTPQLEIRVAMLETISAAALARLQETDGRLSR
jgi:hypothetical protein